MKRKPVQNAPSLLDPTVANEPTGECKTCGAKTRALRCKPCHLKFERWCADTGEPKGSKSAYVPTNRWADVADE